MHRDKLLQTDELCKVLGNYKQAIDKSRGAGEILRQKLQRE